MYKKRVFIVAPSALFPEDKRHDICITSSHKSLHDIYDRNQYWIVASKASRSEAINFAKRLGSKRTTIL